MYGPKPDGSDYNLYTNGGAPWVSSFPPSRDQRGYDVPVDAFGGPHAATFNAVFCDGAVHGLTFGIDYQVYNALGTRSISGGPVPDGTFE
jgi:hypothetical protein